MCSTRIQVVHHFLSKFLNLYKVPSAKCVQICPVLYLFKCFKSFYLLQNKLMKTVFRELSYLKNSTGL